MNDTSETIEIEKTTEDKFYLYLSLIVQGLGSLTLIIIAILRFITTRQNTRLNNIKNIYYSNKNKLYSSEDNKQSISPEIKISN